MEKDKNNYGSHIEFAVLFVTLIGGFYTVDSKFERCHERTDRLYEMYCDTQSEIKQIYMDRNKQ